MATNKAYGDNARIGLVCERSQVLNPKTQLWTKRDTETGGVYKGIRKEK